MGTSCIRKLMYYGTGMVGLILPRNMASLVGQANVVLGGNGFFRGLFQSLIDFGSSIHISSTFVNNRFALNRT
jgi:hypothetical protein